MGKVIIAAISTVIVSIAGANLAGEFFIFYIMPAILVGTIVGAGAILYQRIDELGSGNTGKDEEFAELIGLRDMELLSDEELEEVIERYQKERADQENYEKYEKYSGVLNALKEDGYFSEEQYAERSEGLKRHFNIEGN